MLKGRFQQTCRPCFEGQAALKSLRPPDRQVPTLDISKMDYSPSVSEWIGRRQSTSHRDATRQVGVTLGRSWRFFHTSRAKISEISTSIFRNILSNQTIQQSSRH